MSKTDQLLLIRPELELLTTSELVRIVLDQQEQLMAAKADLEQILKIASVS